MLVACVLYGVARSTGRSVRFRVAERAALTAAPHVEAGVFGPDAAELEPPSADAGPRGSRGEARELYNGLFLDKARVLLEAMVPVAAVAEEEERVEEEMAAVEEEEVEAEAEAEVRKKKKRRRVVKEKPKPKQAEESNVTTKPRGVRKKASSTYSAADADADAAAAAAAAAALPPPPPPPAPPRRVPLSAMTAADVERRELAARRLERGGVTVAFTPNSKVRYDRGGRGLGGGGGGGGGGMGGAAKAAAGGGKGKAPAPPPAAAAAAIISKKGMTPLRE